MRELLTGQPGLDSMELTKWLAWFDAKHEREENARALAEHKNELQKWVDGG